MMLHDWFYEIITRICYDREYLYPCFVRNFGDFMNGLYRQAGMQFEGEYRAAGLKSNKDAVFGWQMSGKGLDLFGANAMRVTCRIRERDSQQVEEMFEGVFDLTTGQCIEGRQN